MSGWTWNSKEEDTYRAAVKEKLDAILEQTTITNGRLRKAERKIDVLMVAYGAGSAILAWLIAKAVQ